MNFIPAGQQLARTPVQDNTVLKPPRLGPPAAENDGVSGERPRASKAAARDLTVKQDAPNWESFSEIVLPARKPLQNLGVNKRSNATATAAGPGALAGALKRADQSRQSAVEPAKRHKPASSHEDDGRRQPSSRNSIPSGSGLARTPVTEQAPAQDISSRAERNAIPSGSGLARTPMTELAPAQLEANKATRNDISSGNGLARTPLTNKAPPAQNGPSKVTRNAIPSGNGLARTPLTEQVPAHNDASKATRNVIPSGNGLARTPLTEQAPAHDIASMAVRNASGSGLSRTSMTDQVPVQKDATKTMRNAIPSGSGLARTPLPEQAPAQNAPNKTVRNAPPSGNGLAGTPLSEQALVQTMPNKASRNAIPSGGGLARTPVTEPAVAQRDPSKATHNAESSGNRFAGSSVTDHASARNGSNKTMRNAIPSGSGLARTPLVGQPAMPNAAAAAGNSVASGDSLATTPMTEQQVPVQNKAMRNAIPSGSGLARTPLVEQLAASNSATVGRSVVSPGNKLSGEQEPVQEAAVKKARNAIPSGAGLARTPLTDQTLAPNVSWQAASDANEIAKSPPTEVAVPEDALKKAGRNANATPTGTGLARTPPVDHRAAANAAAPGGTAAPSGKELAGGSVDGGQLAAPSQALEGGTSGNLRKNSSGKLATSPAEPATFSRPADIVHEGPASADGKRFSPAPADEADLDSDEASASSFPADNEDDVDVDNDDDKAEGDAFGNTEQAYLQHLENVKNLERIREELHGLRRRHKELSQRSDEVEYRSAMLEESAQEVAQRTAQATTWLRDRGLLGTDEDLAQASTLERFAKDRLAEAVGHISSEIESTRAEQRKRARVLRRAREEAVAQAAGTPAFEKLERAREEEQVLRERMRQQSLTIRSIESKMRECDSVLSTPARELSDEEVRDLRMQQGHLHQELRSLHSAQVTEKSEAAARVLLRRVEMFVVRYETLRRSARLLRRRR